MRPNASVILRASVILVTYNLAFLIFSASTNVRWLLKHKKHTCSLLQISYTEGKNSVVEELDGDE